MDQERNDNHWRIDKHVSAGHIMTTVSMVIAGIWFAASLNERIALNEQAIRTNKAAIEAQDTRVTKTLDTISEKLDKLQDILLRRSVYGE